jgi:hypothetical protein
MTREEIEEKYVTILTGRDALRLHGAMTAATSGKLGQTWAGKHMMDGAEENRRMVRDLIQDVFEGMKAAAIDQARKTPTVAEIEQTPGPPREEPKSVLPLRGARA